MAFTKNILKNSEDSHQTSPAYVLTFTRWSNRDVVNYKLEGSLSTRKPLAVVNDATKISVNYSKSNPNPTFSCTLKQGDLNYLTAIHPGDYVIVNMVNWKDKAMRIRERALKGKPINKVDDGFKGLFKIQDVRMILSTNPNGIKEYEVEVTATGFDEFNNIIYFNPAFVEDTSNEKDSEKLDFLFLNNFKNFLDLIRNKEKNNVQFLLKEIIKRTIGQQTKIRDKEGALNQIEAYKVPSQVPGLINKSGVIKMGDINNYYFGIWQPTKSGSSSYSSFFKEDNTQSSVKKENNINNFYNTGKDLDGTRALDLQDFQSVKVWSMIQDYSNPVINESYTCYRIGRDEKYIYPSLVVRQKPFNTEHYEYFASGGASSSRSNPAFIAAHTKFLDLPRWKIDPDLILNLNLGRSGSGRINFVQIFTKSLSTDPRLDQASQIIQGNFIEDREDIIRHGRKPYIQTANYDYANLGTDISKEIETKGPKWSRLVADWVFNGHLKMNGSINCVGIEDPICIGDNLELDGVVYHIETISHNMIIAADGKNIFRTNITLSMGVSTKSTNKIPVYAEMDRTDSRTRREDDYKNEKMLPGFSDTQDLPGRTKGEEVQETLEKSFTNPNSTNKDKKR